jgi:SAM-dependent methyltransferase
LNRPKEVAVLTRMMELGHQHRLLDVGCGDGYLTTKFAKRAREVVGLDPDAKMLAAARTLHAKPNVRFDEGAAEQLPYADAAFERVVAVSVVEHFRDPAAGLKEMARVLKPGGVLALSVDSLLPENSPATFRTWHASRYHVTTYFHLDQILDLIRAAGLQPDPASVQGLHTSRCGSACRRFYMRHKAWCLLLFPLFLAACRLSDSIGLGGRLPPQILILCAHKPQSVQG